MEYCENGSLGALLDHGGRIEDELYVVDYAYQLLSGLAYLHENNIVHRDIKPDSNVFVDEDLINCLTHSFFYSRYSD